MQKKRLKYGGEMGSQYYFNLNSIEPKKSYTGGTIVDVTSDQTPGLVNISFSGMRLDKEGVLEPIWHPNAHKIGYCLRGQALVSIRTPTKVESFTVKEGDIFFIPKGYIHHIQNIGGDENTIKFAYNNAKPETMFLSKAIYSISDDVFKATFNTPSTFFTGLKKSKKEELISQLNSKIQAPQTTSSSFKFNIAESNKALTTKGGYLQIGTKRTLPILEGLGILRFGLNPGGVVEPHWHTNAGELVYIVKGQTKITVLSPDGKVETMEVKGGEGAFAPASFFHNIQNIGSDEVEVIAFFSDAEPDYIGIGEVFGSYSNETLGSIFDVAPNYFDTFKKPNEPLVIVPVH